MFIDLERCGRVMKRLSRKSLDLLILLLVLVVCTVLAKLTRLTGDTIFTSDSLTTGIGINYIVPRYYFTLEGILDYFLGTGSGFTVYCIFIYVMSGKLALLTSNMDI